MEHNIARLGVLLAKGDPSESDYVYILALLRKEIEAIGAEEASKYCHVKLLCDWALHPAIDRSNVGSQIVVDIHNVLDKKRHSDTNDIINEVSKALFGKFRKELSTLLTSMVLPCKVDNDRNWKHFLQNLLEIISYSPVLLRQRDETCIAVSPLKDGMWAISMQIVRVNYDKLADENVNSSTETYCLEVLTSDTTRIVVPVSPRV